MTPRPDKTITIKGEDRTAVAEWLEEAADADDRAARDCDNPDDAAVHKAAAIRLRALADELDGKIGDD